ncbi:MAG: hypothetical protein JW866_05220 [Ignavibacteriales bacterium]|nr:hypothetical protein [Ignavibacteriales bacterium]
MKLGCFFKSIFLVITIIGIAYYVIDKYGQEILDYGVDKIYKEQMDRLISNIEKVEESVYKDRVKLFVFDLISKAEKGDYNIVIDQNLSILAKIEEAIRDNIIEEEEFLKINEEYIKNERHKEN